MVIIKKSFSIGGIDGDTSPKELSPKAFLNIENGRFSVSESGRSGRLENCNGTTLINQPILPSGTHQTIGSTVWSENNMIIYFNWNSGGEHGIYAYAKSTGTLYKVLLNSQVTGGLNFDKDTRINRNAKVVNGVVYFTDGTPNGFRKVNIEAGIKLNHAGYTTTQTAYIAPLNFSEITVIAPPPAYPPAIQKETDGAFSNNFIANENFSFAYQFTYRDNEQTVVGAYSRGSRLNKSTDTYNRISVKMNSVQVIPNNVRLVELVVRIGNKASVVKTWDRLVASESTEITNHNSGTTALSFNFYNNITGRFLDDASVLKPYDSVPILSKTIDFTKARLFAGNNLEGYNSPDTTSFSHSLSSTGITVNSFGKRTVYVIVPSWYSGYYVYLYATEASPSGYYLITSTEVVGSGSPISPPTSVAFSGLTFIGTADDVKNRVHTLTSGAATVYSFLDGAYIVVTGVTASVFDVFKSRAQYMGGVVFYDFAMRKCGVVKGSNIISIPKRDYDYTTATQGITVSVDSTNRLNEIPDWAYYYSFVRTLNLRTRFFAEGFDNNSFYATKDKDGKYVFTQKTYVTGAVGIAIDTTSLVQSGLGYAYDAGNGDICYLIKSDNTTHELPVIGQDGKYVIVKAKDIGDLTSQTFVYELFTPYQASEQEPFFEMGNIYPVANPTTGSRDYTTKFEVWLPDYYVMTRNYQSATYFAEAMCPNDAYWKRNDNDGGKVNYVTKLGQVQKTNSISFSNTFIQGTSVNGLSTFEALNQEQVPLEAGTITALRVATKVVGEGQGAVMLAICSKRPASLYIGEAQISASSKEAFLIKANGVIGSINVLKDEFGCINPETVIDYDGLVFWLDLNRGEVAQYSANGADCVSRYGLSRFFKSYCRNYQKTFQSAMDTLNGFHHIPTAIDPSFRKEFLVVTPALVAEAAMADLPSYTSTPSYATSIKNRFDVSDKQGKAMALSIDNNVWHSYKFVAEWFEYLNSTMYGFKNGQVYIMDDDAVNTNTFFGVQQPLRVCFAVNEISSGEKDAANISIEGNKVPDFTVVYVNDNNEQITDLIISDYIKQEIASFAKVLRDRLSPNVSGTADEKLYTGDVVKGHPLYVMMEFQCYNGLMYVDAVNVGVNVSKGVELVIAKK
jgi:hypothetical protein